LRAVKTWVSSTLDNGRGLWSLEQDRWGIENEICFRKHMFVPRTSSPYNVIDPPRQYYVYRYRLHNIRMVHYPFYVALSFVGRNSVGQRTPVFFFFFFCCLRCWVCGCVCCRGAVGWGGGVGGVLSLICCLSPSRGPLLYNIILYYAI